MFTRILISCFLFLVIANIICGRTVQCDADTDCDNLSPASVGCGYPVDQPHGQCLWKDGENFSVEFN